MARFLREPRELSDDEADAILSSPQGRQIAEMMTYSAVGSAEAVTGYLDDFVTRANVDELMTVHPSPTIEQRLRSIELLAGIRDGTTDPRDPNRASIASAPPAP